MPKIKIDTKSDLYDPIEIEVLGKNHILPPINHAYLSKIDEFDKRVLQGCPHAPYERIEFILGMTEVNPGIRDLDIRTLRKITDALTRAIYFPEDNAEKKKQPGGKKLKKLPRNSQVKSHTTN